VAEHFLDRAEVGAAVEEVRRAGVPERVRVEVGASGAGEAVATDDELGRPRAEPAPAGRDEYGARRGNASSGA
jgi:hypothetical protein